MAYSLARSGDTSFAKEVRSELEEKLKHEYVSPVELATINLGLVESGRAMDWAERACEERRGWAAYLAVHPVVDTVREELRFQALARKMGLDKIRAPR